MSAKHTPGPWYVGPERNNHYSAYVEIMFNLDFGGGSPTVYHLADVRYPATTGNTVGSVERTANARLIAAAPELLSAIIDLADAARSACNAAQHSALVQALFDADYAIAKANGVAK